MGSRGRRIRRGGVGDAGLDYSAKNVASLGESTKHGSYATSNVGSSDQVYVSIDRAASRGTGQVSRHGIGNGEKLMFNVASCWHLALREIRHARSTKADRSRSWKFSIAYTQDMRVSAL